ncbi:hypothetical protein CEXT_159261 [Caerostris extrusa]|uniref:Uncharacterized protein n=1 Tax=Caerostris extrusa TaxID=172846 RepID=A0AAV4SJH3_CAEEX|nr:hypothetical protein CEXT_159261 [Caerostris extrusa]
MTKGGKVYPIQRPDAFINIACLLILQAPVIGSDGKSAVLAEGDEGDEFLLILDPEDPGRYSENCIVNSTIEIQSESVSQEIVRSDVIQTTQFIPADDSGGTVYIQRPCEFTLVDSENSVISTENLTKIAGHAEFKDGKFFLDSETLKNLTSNKKILQIASVTDQVPSEIKLSNSESVVEIECPSSTHEGYVIFKETISLSNFLML